MRFIIVPFLCRDFLTVFIKVIFPPALLFDKAAVLFKRAHGKHEVAVRVWVLMVRIVQVHIYHHSLIPEKFCKCLGSFQSLIRIKFTGQGKFNFP